MVGMIVPFLSESIAVLERTPATLAAQLRGLPEAWTKATEGPETWSPYDVLGHLVHGERADWMPRIEMILHAGAEETFAVFDRQAQFKDSVGKSLEDLLDEFASLRRQNLERLGGLSLGVADLELTGRHPAFGVVTLRQLLATWTAHDLAHLVQISRVMAKRYRDEVGPWAEYLSVMR
jgi:hypothetical protein